LLLRALGYPFCNVGISIGVLPFNLFLLYYLPEIVGLPAGLAGTAIALPKAWDALIDPAFGGWIDRVSMRLGSRSPAILVSTAVFAITLVAIFSLPTHGAPLPTFAIVTVLLIASSTAQTGIGVSQYALATEITTNPFGLSRLIAIATIVAQIAAVVGGGSLPLLIAARGGGAAGYAGMAIVVAIGAGVALAIFAGSMHGVPLTRQADEADRLSTWSSLVATMRNRLFYRTVGLVICLNASIAIQLGFLPFANQYVLRGDAHSLALIESELGACVLIGMIAAPLLVRRLPVISSMQWCNLSVALALVALFLASYGPFWTSAVLLGVIGVGSGAIGVLIQTAILEAARIRIPGHATIAIGFYLGIMVAGIKLGSSAGALASGAILAVFGFDAKQGIQSDLALLGLRLGYTLIPLVFVLAGTLFIYRAVLPERATRHGN
jgi:Na+/melibiose symporter-like transporter